MQTNEKPKVQKFHLEGVKHVSAREAYGCLLQQKAVLIDVREKEEFEVEQLALPDAMHIPMPEVIDRLGQLPADRWIIVMDTQGERGTKVANLLNRQGYNHVANLDGGLVQWKAEGLPVEDILPDACGGCCGCG